MTAARRILAGYVALCLALAGLVNLSPSLHLWIEHGGQGAAHVHSHAHPVPSEPEVGGSFRSARFHRHPDGSVHDAAHSARATFAGTLPPEPRVGRLFPGHRTFSLPWARVARMGRAMLHWVVAAAASTDADASDTEPSGHHHTGLAQILSQGLVELVIDLPMPVASADVLRDLTWVPPSPFCGIAWDLQSASRGPPDRGV